MKNLIKAAKEINSLGFEPELPTSKETGEKKLTKILKDATSLLEEEEIAGLSEGTRNTLIEIGALEDTKEATEITEDEAILDDDMIDADEDLEADEEDEDYEAEEIEEVKEEKKPATKPVSKPVSKPASKPASKPKTEGTEVKINQTELIRTCLRKKITRAKTITELSVLLGKTEKETEARLKLYEKHYGLMGINDKNI